MTIGDRTIGNNEKGQLVFVESKYYIGQPIEFNPGDQLRKWYVIGEDADTVTLLLDQNLDDPVAWISSTDAGESEVLTEKGPITALTYLNKRQKIGRM